MGTALLRLERLGVALVKCSVCLLRLLTGALWCHARIEFVERFKTALGPAQQLFAIEFDVAPLACTFCARRCLRRCLGISMILPMEMAYRVAIFLKHVLL